MLKETKLVEFIEEYNDIIKTNYELIKHNIKSFKISFFDFKKMYLLVKSRVFLVFGKTEGIVPFADMFNHDSE